MRDWDRDKVTDQVIERRDGRDPLHRKKAPSSSSKRSPSSSESRGRHRKREDKHRQKQREKQRRSQEKGEEMDTNSDEYWLQLRKKLGLK